jgi:hypothetical protein
MNRGTLFWAVMAAVAAILVYQLFIPPVIGLADQNDFKRTLGRFGYGAVHSDGSLNLAWVEPKYVPNPNFREPDWDQFSSEYLFVGTALLINKVLSKDGRLDVTIIGLVHALAFLAIFARFLFVTRNCRARALPWIGAIVIFTDVGYVAYWNSFYAEPASGLFALLLLTESVDISVRRSVSGAGLARWSLWAILLVLAKPQNAPVGVLLGLFCPLVLRSWVATRAARYGAWIGCAAIVAASGTMFLTAPVAMKDHNTYNLVFLAIVPESRNASTDLKSLGLDPRLRDYSTTGAWSSNTAFPTLHESGAIGRVVTLMTVVRFYMLRPTRMWRHIQTKLPLATSLRPEWCGNFEPSAGYPAGARSGAFALWSSFHQRALVHGIKYILFLLPIPPFFAVLRRVRGIRCELWVDFSGLLALCCLAAFLTALFGDAWDNVRHLYLFNLLLDVCLLGGIALMAQRAAHRRTASSARDNCHSLP